MDERTWLLIALTIIIITALAACGGGKETASEAQPVEPAKAISTGAAQPTEVPAEAPKPTTLPEPTKAPAAESTAAPTPEEETLSLTSRAAGLDKLKSYRAQWAAEWKSTGEGKNETGTWNWEEDFTTEPAKARHLLWRASESADSSKETQFEIWQIGDTMYMKAPDEAECMAISSEDSAKNLEQGIFSPGALGDIKDGKYVGSETVNGIPTKHYEYTSKLGAMQGAGDVTGESWVAIDGGYVVKDTVTWKGGSGFLGLSGETGEGSWTWELTEVNEPIVIEQPAACVEPAGADLPVMPDAEDKTSMNDTLIYKSASSVTDVVNFYKDALAEADWKLDGEPTEMGDVSTLAFVKGVKKLSLIVSASEGKTQVMLSLSEQ
jgi:hypothetical protein